MSVSQAEDKEVAELVGAVWDISEINGVVVLVAEGRPEPEQGVVGLACLSGSGLGGVLQSRAEISLEACLDGR